MLHPGGFPALFFFYAFYLNQPPPCSTRSYEKAATAVHCTVLYCIVLWSSPRTQESQGAGPPHGTHPLGQTRLKITHKIAVAVSTCG